MKLFTVAALCGLLLTAWPVARAQETGAEPRRELLGLSLGMSKEAVHQQLRKRGQLLREERKRQEVWKVRDAHFAHVLVGFDTQDQLRYVTALAREGGSHMRYREVGDLKQARNEGAVNNYYYVWELAARDNQPRGLVIVRGTDAEYLSSYSLKKID